MSSRIKKVKLKGNESFNFREGWLRKGMRCVEECPTLFSQDDVMERLGVGSKMVKSIRFWLQATGLCEERYINSGRARAQYLTEDFGEIVQKWDPYFDDIFTLFLLHYQIVCHQNLCMPWNIFFNEYEGQGFTKENMIVVCKDLLYRKMDEGSTFSENSFADDCSSIIRMYSNQEIKEDPEESLSCPLSELGLLQRSYHNKATFYKAMPTMRALDKLAVLYVITQNLNSGKNSVSIEDLQYAPNNVGRIYNLTRVAINDYLDQLRISGYLTINRTAGLDMVYVENLMQPQDIMIEYYKNAQVR